MMSTNLRNPLAADAVPLLAGFDTIAYSSQARISQELRAQLAKEKEAAIFVMENLFGVAQA